MELNLSLQLMSNVISILICITIVTKYLKYKKRLDVLQGLEELKDKNELTNEDYDYIQSNEKEYKDKALKSEGLIKFLNPVFILITGIIFAFTPMSEAMIYMNVVVVSYLFIILDNLTFAPKTK
ncbi:hypothetical protein GCM10012288_20430 [Malaciobacter pacificus]|uniref:Putative membrane protein n=1 Tax=Malaciobacter pacificus TaxID=1080223 RepID=A0A5C2HFJ2_9BACT|nr:hypothetical protein [Malaciobacter pacificus]QEP35604.1 putative membrane protein [Malaciobacter pacificus]GGD46087.1 hypothetical protein GCM10012288_20430 [Malaciobacter pacificus]